MDGSGSSVDKMKLTKYGFRLNLIAFASGLSVMGIMASSVGIFGVFVLIGVVSAYPNSLGGLTSTVIYAAGPIIIILLVAYLAMWILLIIKTRKQDILGIEQIGKIYSYVSGTLEIMGAIAGIVESAVIVGIVAGEGDLGLASLGFTIGQSVCSTIYLIFACLKIHGIRVKRSKLLGAYIGFRYVFFILYMIGLAISAHESRNSAWIAIIVGFVFFNLDIGLAIILHSIRVDKENNEKLLDTF